MHRTALVLTGLLMLPAGLAAQQQPQQQQPQGPPPCTEAEFDAFDYWLGEWTVTNPGGTVVGSNVITSVSDGCGLLEEWTGARGTTGTSINYYDRSTGKWHQVWVGAGASILHLEGGPVDGVMQLSGERRQADGATVIDRIRWIPDPKGTVRQHWETSTDGGKTWTTAFDGTYTKRDEG